VRLRVARASGNAALKGAPASTCDRRHGRKHGLELSTGRTGDRPDLGLSLSARRKGAEIYATWLGWGGLVIAAVTFLLAVPIQGVSLILLLSWALVVSVLMLPDCRKNGGR
jgi:hypothetical protein